MVNTDYEELPEEQMPQLYVSDEERVLVKQHIILPYVIKTLQHDIKIMKNLELKAAESYVKEFDNVVIEVFKEMNVIHKQLREQNIKVYEVKRDSKMGHWEYILRGNRHEIGFMWSIVRAEVEEYLMAKFKLNY